MTENAPEKKESATELKRKLREMYHRVPLAETPFGNENYQSAAGIEKLSVLEKTIPELKEILAQSELTNTGQQVVLTDYKGLFYAGYIDEQSTLTGLHSIPGIMKVTDEESQSIFSPEALDIERKLFLEGRSEVNARPHSTTDIYIINGIYKGVRLTDWRNQLIRKYPLTHGLD